MVFIIVMFCVSCTFCMAQTHEQSPAHKITSLRQKQITASYNEYYLCEKEIDRVKSDHGTSQHFRLEKWQRSIMGLVHLFPLIIWQLIALACAACLVWLRGHSFLLFFFLIVSCGIVWLAYQERTQDWLVVAEKEVPLYLGPGTTYPIHAQLSYLEEVCLKNKKDEWLCVQANGTVGWMHYG